MNEEIARQLVKQLKRLNFWVTTFGVLFLAGLAVIGVVLFQVVMFVKKTNDAFQQTTSKLNVQRQACEGSGAVADFLKHNNLCP
jgi:hypothetical protein